MSLPHTLHIGRPDGVINWRMPLRLLLVNLSLLALCLAMAVAALCYGTLQLSLEQVFAALSGEAPKNLVTVVTQWRLPRIAMALLLGAALGMSGAIFQSIIRNPLGSPDVIGFNMGAYTGALIAITLFNGGYYYIAGGALAGGILSALAIYLLAWRQGIAGFR
ncbi:iron chelate uptake ABC transporter family permease subunit, partial [Serratia marcescens]|uniref:iron chelate uptake ABC transporter family permease subunit n=3 Tax=Serratia TaxID=613 RepID=UPI001BD53502